MNFVSRLEIKKLLHDATWEKMPTREDVIDEFTLALVEGKIPDIENFKVTILNRKG